jgi:hypothetical protein
MRNSVGKVMLPTLTPNPLSQPETPKKAKPCSIVQQPFSANETAFWNCYGISPEILRAYKVISLKEFGSENSDGKPFTFHSTDTEPLFGYHGNGSY